MSCTTARPTSCTHEVGAAALAAGKHLIAEKPLASTLEDAIALVDAAAGSGVVAALCHNYRHFAMVAEARELIRSGAIGEVFLVHGVFLQDWLSPAGVHNWRLDPDVSGPSTTFADIGTHWCDLAMHLTACPIESVCAVTGSRHGRPIDDHGGALLRFAGRRARDARLVSGLAWCQEQPPDPARRLGGIAVLGSGEARAAVLGRQGAPTELRHKSAAELHGPAQHRAHLPAGELEGWNTTFVNLFECVYRTIIGAPLPGDDWVATLADGLFLMRVIDAVTRSSAERAWVDL